MVINSKVRERKEIRQGELMLGRWFESKRGIWASTTYQIKEVLNYYRIKSG